jgi:hypothetical protein
MIFNLSDHLCDHLAVASWDSEKITPQRGPLSADDITDLTHLLSGLKSVSDFAVLQTPVDVQIILQGEEVPTDLGGVLDFSHLLEGARSLAELGLRLEGIGRRVAAGRAAGWEISTPVSQGSYVVRSN